MTHSLYMPIYWGDYFADTLGFSTFQHGIYLLLIAHYWQNGGPIPDDTNYLANVARCSHTNFVRYGNRVLAKFTRENGSLRHQRIDSELLKSTARQTAAATAGKASAAKRNQPPYHTKEKERRARAQPLSEGVVCALAPGTLEELKDKTDRIMKRGKYAERFG